MKKINKCLTMFSTLLLILTSLFSVAPAFADDATTDTVTLHKIVMPQAAFDNFTEGTKGKNDSAIMLVNKLMTLNLILAQPMLKKSRVLSLFSKMKLVQNSLLKMVRKSILWKLKMLKVVLFFQG